MDQIDLVVLIDLKSPIDLIDLRGLVDQREQLQGELIEDQKDSDWG